MVSNVSFPGKILLATDFSDASITAFRYAIDLSRSKGSQLELLYVSAAPAIPFAMYEYMPSTEDIESMRKEAREQADQKIEEVSARYFSDVAPVTTVIEHIGSSADAIVEHARTGGHGLIIIATHGHGLLAHAALGSVAERVLRSSPCPVLVVPSKGLERAQVPYRRILVFTDFSEASQVAFAVAVSEAKRTNAGVSVVHVIENPIPHEILGERILGRPGEAEAILRHYRSVLERRLEAITTSLGGRDFSRVVLEKTHSVANTLTEYAKTSSADLIVMATKGAGNALTWIGGVAERLVRHSPCPVLIVPQKTRAAAE